MKPNRLNCFCIKQLLATATFFAMSVGAHAADSSWNVNADGNWTDGFNWNPATEASDADFTATFANDITTDRIVTLNAPRTIGNITFGDADTGTAGSWLISGNILTLDRTTGSPTITVNALGLNKAATISSQVTGSDGLTKEGTGTLVLSNTTNNFTGGATVNAGTLEYADSTGFGFAVSNTLINANGTLNLRSSSTSVDTASTNSGTITGTGTLNKVGDGYLGTHGSFDVSGFTGQVNVLKGVLGSNGNAGWANNTNTMKLNVASGAAFDVRTGTVTVGELTGGGHIGTTFSQGVNLVVGNLDTDTTFSGVIENTLTHPGLTNITNGGGLYLWKDGAGTLTLTGANTYTGTTTISGGTLEIGGEGTLGAGGTFVGAISVAAGATFKYNSSATQTLSNTISGAGKFEVAAGQVNLAKTGFNQIENTGGILIRDGGILNTSVTTANSIRGNIELRNGGTLTSSAAGTDPFGNYFVYQATTFTGTGANNVISNSDIGLVSALTLNTALSTDSLLVSANLGFSTEKTGSLIKTGAGTATLSGTNIYTGTTTVSAGKLVINGSISTSVLTTVQSGGTLGGGVGIVAGSVGALKVESGGILAPGNSAGILNVGNTELQLGSNFNVELTGGTVAGTNYDQLNVTGSVSLAGALNLTITSAPGNDELFFILNNDGLDTITTRFSNAPDDDGFYTLDGQEFQISYNGNYDFGNPANSTFDGGNDVVLMAVPEPASALLGSLGLLALLRRRRN